MTPWRLGGATLLALAFAPAVAAQDIRITGATWVQSIDLRPLRRDSVLASATTGTGEVRRTADGQRVSCVEGTTFCRFLGNGPRETTRPFLQDLGVAAWGLGEGISVHAHARFRESLGGAGPSWPRLGDRFDLLDAYIEVDRSRFRARLGRQWTLGGLGAYAFDGGALALRRDWIDGEAFGGRALVQGLFEPYTSAEIGLVDDLPPETAAWLMGARVRVRAGASTAVTANYLRVLQDDRSGLYAERASVDASARVAGTRLTANYAVDLASLAVNELRLRGGRPFGRFDVALEVRRHRPFFELWTIWGAFAPVAFDEARATAGWRTPSGGLQLTASGARRRYEDAGTGLTSIPLRNDGWRGSLDATWALEERWTINAGYGVDIGFGSSQGDGSAGVSWRGGDRVELGATATALQTIYEFRVGTGRVVGVGANGALRLTSDMRLRVDAGVWRHRLTNDAPGQDWSQRRASARLEWAVGADPGKAR